MRAAAAQRSPKHGIAERYSAALLETGMRGRRHARGVEENDRLRTVSVAQVAARRDERRASGVQLLHDAGFFPTAASASSGDE
jgi:hypothetical protein